jgi:NTE family protein
MLKFSSVDQSSRPSHPVRIGLALGGGFARGIAHAGILRVFERHNIPLHCIAGVSAGSIAASAFGSGASADDIARSGSSMRFADVARWSINRMGLMGSCRMENFLRGLLQRYRFEHMRTPLAVVATDLSSGEPVVFRQGDVFLPVRASCSYPGLFQPVHHGKRLLVDGAMSMEIPALACRQMGATHVIAVNLPSQGHQIHPSNMFQVLNRCFQIMQARVEQDWREVSDMILTPDVRGMQWDAFANAAQLIEAGERAALDALPQIRQWLAPQAPPARRQQPTPVALNFYPCACHG